ncbi:MAG: hypothetical protein GX638_03235 [Crenarchaeota archaeon]|nr:hypothetical protein [Thermoproteota archaeon]
MDKTFIECDCGSELLLLDHMKEEKLIALAMYTYSHGRQHPWKWRLGLIQNIFKKGYPYADSIVLNRDEAYKLANYLYDFVIDVDSHKSNYANEGDN